MSQQYDYGELEVKPTSQYNTPLTPQEETQFQSWKATYAPKDSGADYDLRGAFKAGLKPAANGHWPDTFKKPNHPTFSNESKYAVGPDAAKAGYWVGPNHDQFVPPSQAKTYDYGDLEAAQPSIAELQAQSKATFEANQPESHLGINLSASTLWEQLKQGGSQFLFGPKPGERDYSPSTGASEMLGGISAGGPSTEGLSLFHGLKQAPAVKSIAGLGQRLGLLNAPLSAADQIAQKMAPAGKLAKLMTIDLAPELAKDTELITAKDFDAALFGKYQAAGKSVNIAEAAVPDAKPVPRGPILNGIEDLAKQYEGTGADDAAKAIRTQATKLNKAAENKSLNWETFSAFKQRLGNDLKTTGVWKRLATDAATEKDQALARAYGLFMQMTGEISPELKTANQTFSTLHDAMTASGLDLDTGTRIAAVGKPIAPSIASRAMSVAGKTALPFVAGSQAANLYEKLRSAFR